jgi:CRISPR/Cas system CSM-associated protein Csm3 (group 7 of RAMP superfamily)
MTQLRSSCRVEVTGELIAITPLRVGSTRPEHDLDLVVLRDGLGRPLVPGDSLAGAVRAWAEARSNDESARRGVATVFGPRAGDEHRRLAAALITFADAALATEVETRSGVGIDRATGAAAPNVFYGFEVVPRGTRIALRVELELPADPAATEQARRLLGSILRALGEGDISLGGMRSRGLGAVRLDRASLAVREFDYSSRSSTVEALAGGRERSLQWLGASDHLRERPSLRATVTWAPHGAVMSKAAQDGIAIDTIPLMGAVEGGQVAPVLPGSSIKGVLRSRAEWFCRTLSARDVPPATNGTGFLEQVAGLRPVDLLFGSVKRADDGDARRSRRGALRVRDCYGTVSIGDKAWRLIRDSIDDQATAALIDSDPTARHLFDPAMHVAIDRFTGGAADSLLYSVLEVRDARWEPITLELDLDLLAVDTDERERLAAIGLFHVLVKMLRHDQIRLGFGSMRGAGRMLVTDIDLDVPEACPAPDVARAALRAYCTAEAV